MKNFKTLFLIMSIIVFTLHSCNNEDETMNVRNQKYVEFTGSIETSLRLATRAQATSWDTGDAIGVYMKNASGFVSTAENVKYTTSGSGAFTPATTGIEFPVDGSNVDFISYYPYQTTITGYIYPINVANQAPLSAIDLLYSNETTGVNKTTPIVSLNFKHQLSQLILNVSAGGGITSLTGLTASIKDLTTNGSFDISTGAITIGSTKSTFSPVTNVSSATAAVANAILVPGQNLNTAKVTFALNGKIWDWTPSSMDLVSGKKYTYSISLTQTGIVVLNPNATIEDWTEGNTEGSGIILTPNEDPKFEANKTSVSLGASTILTDVVALTTQSTETWTAASSETWLTLSSTGGTGSGNITLTATTNTGAARTATVTLTPSTATLVPITITVNQAAVGVLPSSLLFSGSDFENWAAFTANLSSFGLQLYASQSTTGGRNGSSALHINGMPTANDYLFTAQATSAIPSTATKIVLYIKGTSPDKSLSFNVYSPDAGAASGYYKFNLGVCGQQDMTLTSSAANAYTGNINTNGQWVKITLNIAGYNLNSTGNLFALKTGNGSAYDLYVDDITFE